MTRAIDLAALTPHQRTETILAAARENLSGRLWRAALGGAYDGETPQRSDLTALRTGRAAADLNGLLATLTKAPAPEPPAIAGCAVTVVPPPSPPRTNELPMGVMSLPNINQPFAPALEDAARRTGIPAAALAAIIDAEAGRNAKGGWNIHSRNPRSSAAGLGQFLSGTWLDLARTPGTWLNREARARGLIDGEGHIATQGRGLLLAMRYDPGAAIETVADYARANLDRMRGHGISLGTDARDIARAGYIGHHLGVGDALRFYNGTLGEARARVLLMAQIGERQAAQRIVSSGDATAAHRAWLLGHIDRNVRPERYAALNFIG